MLRFVFHQTECKICLSSCDDTSSLPQNTPPVLRSDYAHESRVPSHWLRRRQELVPKVAPHPSTVSLYRCISKTLAPTLLYKLRSKTVAYQSPTETRVVLFCWSEYFCEQFHQMWLFTAPEYLLFLGAVKPRSAAAEIKHNGNCSAIL
jgi:hypothetical protein